MHQQSHTLIRLAVHLVELQRVYYREGEEAAAAERPSTKNIHLTSNDESAHHLLYPEIPKHYVLNDKEKKWLPRRRGRDKIISSMYSVSPSDPEKVYP